MNNHPLYQVMHPRSLAFYGASNDRAKMGTFQLLNLLEGKYPGKIYPIHLKEETVLGLKAYRSARELPEAVDLAILTLPPSVVPEVLRDLGERGVKRAIIISGGFRETGEKGRALENQIVEIARSYGLRFLGPNCIGVIHPSFHLIPTLNPYHHQPGTIGVASQSGTYVTQILPLLAKSQIGYSQAFSVGNGADLDLLDCLEYLGEDPETRAIVLYIEGLKKPLPFIRMAREVSRRKPILGLYVGGTEAGRRSAASHTGSIAGPDHLYEALFRQSGVIRVYSVEDLFEWAWALASLPLPRGRNMAIVTHSGGPASSLADACNRLGLRVPLFSTHLQEELRRLLPAMGSARNPVDLTFSIDMPTLLGKLPRMVLEDPSIDGLLLHGAHGIRHLFSGKEIDEISSKIPGFSAAEKAIAAAVAALSELPSEFRKPVITSAFVGREEDEIVAFLQDRHLPCYRSPERAVRAMAALCQYSEIRSRMEAARNQ